MKKKIIEDHGGGGGGGDDSDVDSGGGGGDDSDDSDGDSGDKKIFHFLKPIRRLIQKSFWRRGVSLSKFGKTDATAWRWKKSLHGGSMVKLTAVDGQLPLPKWNFCKFFPVCCR